MRLYRFFFCALLLFVFPVVTLAQGAALLTIRFAGGSNQFRVGEIIPVELSFSASLNETYDVDSRSYDRSGRLDIEQFHVSPPGRDPLQTYFAEGRFIGGGLSSGPHPLTSEPWVMREDLNEWVALDAPGHYSLYVTSTRVSRRTNVRPENLELRSNVLDFDVVAADPPWQQQTLNSSLAVLESVSTTEKEREAAIRTLRFLDTAESVHALVKAFNDVPDGRRFDITAGLFGSRYRNLVVRDLEEQMSDPDTAITMEYIYALAKLKFQNGHPPVPPYPQHDTAQQKVWQEQMQVRQRELGDIIDELYRRTATVALIKHGTARSETVRTLLMRSARTPDDVKPFPLLPGTEIASAFLVLPPNQQYGLLTYYWERVKVPAMESALESLAAAPELKDQMLRDAVLKRLYELAPAEATPFIIEEIKHPHRDVGGFTVKAETLSVLPNATMPEFDELLIARLEDRDNHTSQLDAGLIGRYASKAILARAKAVYDRAPGQPDCQIEDGLVTYYLRTDPDYGVHQLANVVSLCMAHSLDALIQLERWNEVQPAVIARLNGSNLWGARAAAETLAKFGDGKAENAMWERLRSFHEQWMSRESEFVSFRQTPREVTDAMGFQYGLVQSLAAAQNWTLTDEQVDELAGLTLGSQRANLKQYRWTSPITIRANVLFDGQLMLDVNDYHPKSVSALAAKLTTFPPGTRFQLSVFGAENRVALIVQQISEAAVRSGVNLEILH